MHLTCIRPGERFAKDGKAGACQRHKRRARDGRHNSFLNVGVELMARMVKCVKLGKEAEGLDYPTYPGELGKRIWESVSKEAWKLWLAHQTMLMNEYRINPMDPKARKMIEGEMEKYFFGEGSQLPEGYVPPASK